MACHRMRRAAAFAGATLAAYVLVGRPRQLQWGATDHEATKPLPGDDLLERQCECDAGRHDRRHTCRGLAIDRPDRPGEGRVLQLRRPRESRWLPHPQRRSHPSPGTSGSRSETPSTCILEVALRVVACAPPALARGARSALPLGDGAPPYDFTWAFVLDGRPDGTTRLLARERYLYTSWWAPLLVEPVEVASWVMSQKMLRGIRERAGRPAPPGWTS